MTIGILYMHHHVLPPFNRAKAKPELVAGNLMGTLRHLYFAPIAELRAFVQSRQQHQPHLSLVSTLGLVRDDDVGGWSTERFEVSAEREESCSI